MLNSFLNNINCEKRYLKSLKNKNNQVLKIKNYKKLDAELFLEKSKQDLNNMLNYVVSISFLPSNSFIHVSDFSGKILFFYSAGSFGYVGKSKRSRYLVFKEFYNILFSELPALKENAIALHLNNVGSSKFWLLKKLKHKFFIKSIRIFNSFPHNGCRKRKMKRKKVRIKKKSKMERWLSGLKRQIVNLLSCLIASSNLALFKKGTEYDAVVACLLWEQKVMCSNHIISKDILYYLLIKTVIKVIHFQNSQKLLFVSIERLRIFCCLVLKLSK